MTVIPVYRPYVFLRCRKCGRKTGHVLINTDTIRKGEIEETYECQECGETKKIYELASTVQLHNLPKPQQPQPTHSAREPTSEVEEKLAIHGLEEKIKAKREAVKQLEFKKKDLEKRLKVTTSAVSAGTRQPKQPEEQPRTIKIKKKKRKWF